MQLFFIITGTLVVLFFVFWIVTVEGCASMTMTMTMTFYFYFFCSVLDFNVLASRLLCACLQLTRDVTFSFNFHFYFICFTSL